MPKLIILFQGQEWSVELKDGANVIGRSSKATVPVRDPSMSREHAEVRLASGVATLVDRGSMNGTLLNGSKVAEQKLVPGDRIQIGNATIFFEEKKGEVPAAVGTPNPASSTKAPTQIQHAAENQPTPPAGTPRVPPSTKRAEPRRALVKDYAVFGKDSTGMPPVLLMSIALVLVGGAGVVGWNLFSGGSAGPVDKENLESYNPSFEIAGDKGAVIGWTLRAGGSSKLTTAEGVAHHGTHSMFLEKSGSPSDLVVEIASQQAHDLQKAGQAEVSGWVKAENFTGLFGLKVTWLTRVGGAVLHEDYSEPAARTADWGLVSKTFPAPAGAGAFIPGFCAVGRSGRIYVDQVRVRRLEGAAVSRTLEVGGFQVTAGSSGAFNVNAGNRRVLSGAQIGVISDKEGHLPQSVSSGTTCTAEPEKNRLVAAGRLFSPVDLRTLDFEQEIEGPAGSVVAGYKIEGDFLKQLDRVAFSFVVPRGEIVGDVSKPVSRVVLRGEGGDFSVDIVANQLAMVTSEALAGARRIVLSIPLDRGSATFGGAFQIRSGSGGVSDPVELGRKAEAEGRMTEARSWFRQALDQAREPERQERIRAELKRIDQAEVGEWNGVQSAAFRARLMRQKSLFDQALQLAETYERRWSNAKYSAAAKAEREKLATEAGGAVADRESERALRLLQEARDCIDGGRKTVAAEILRVIQEQYPATESAAKAAELLKQVK